MEIVKNKPDRNRPIQIIEFMVSVKKANEANTMYSIKPEVIEKAVKDFNEGKNLIISHEHKPRKSEDGSQPPKWVYRLEFKDDSCGLWYNGKGGWCFEEGIGSLSDECKTKTLPMDYDWRYKQDGRDWFSACSKKEDLMHWYSLEDAKTLIDKGFVFTRYLATEYHEYDLETVFIKETTLKREEIDIFELFGDEKK